MTRSPLSPPPSHKFIRSLAVLAGILSTGSLAANSIINEWVTPGAGTYEALANWSLPQLPTASTHVWFGSINTVEIEQVSVGFANPAELDPPLVRNLGGITYAATNGQGLVIRPNTNAGHGGGAFHFHGVPQEIGGQTVTLLIGNYSNQSFTMRGTANASRGNGMDIVLHTSGVIHVADPNGEVALRDWTSSGNAGVMNIREEGGSHSITKTGPGLLTMDSSTTDGYTGGTYINEGMVHYGRTGALGEGPIHLGLAGGPAVSLMRSRAGFDVQNEIIVGANPTGTHTIGTVVGSTTNHHRFNNTIHLNSDLILVNNMSDVSARPGLNFNGDIVGSHTITTTGSGVIRFAGDNADFSGTLVISEGSTVDVGFSTAVSGESLRGTLGTANVVNNGELRFHRINDHEMGNAISGSGTVVQAETGRTALLGASTYTGATLVEQGSLLVMGSINGTSSVMVNASGGLGGTGSITSPAVTVEGTLFAADLAANPGILTINGDLTLTGTAQTRVILGGAGAGQYSSVSGIQNFILDGTITLELSEGFMPGIGETFKVFDWSGTVDATAFNLETDLILPALDAGLDWITSDFTVTGEVGVIPEPSTYALALVGMGVVFGFIRRRRLA